VGPNFIFISSFGYIFATSCQSWDVQVRRGDSGWGGRVFQNRACSM
jgi:hypothetical protein